MKFDIPEFEQNIDSEFNKIWDYCETDSNKEWTIAIKTILEKINQNFFHNKIATSNLQNTESGEWLFDFVIYEENKENYLNKLNLIAEIEWRNYNEYFPQLKYDFEKLLIAKCNYKLFIFEVDDNDELEDHTSKLSKILSNYNENNIFAENEKYYLIIWNRKDQIFKIEKL